MNFLDPEHRGMHAPELPPPPLSIIDAHVHLFPPRVFEAIWRWFRQHAWPIRYPMYVDEILSFLKQNGVDRFFALHYSHTADMARPLNAFVTELAKNHPQIIPFGTVLPGEPDALQIVEESLDRFGHVGLKLHSHVQKFAPDDPKVFPIYEALLERGKLLVLHAGREPSSPAYNFDCRTHCGIDRVRKVMDRYPELKLIVPHLGHDEWPDFAALTRDAPHLHLDTSMALAGFLDHTPSLKALEAVADRLLFGTDFPNLPYPWGHELKILLELGFAPETLAALTRGNATRLLDSIPS